MKPFRERNPVIVGAVNSFCENPLRKGANGARELPSD